MLSNRNQLNKWWKNIKILNNKKSKKNYHQRSSTFKKWKRNKVIYNKKLNQ